MSNQLEHHYALLIGIGECVNPEWSLPVTVNDVKAFKEVLVSHCGYIEDNIHLLFNEQATKDGILKGFKWLKQQVENDSEATVIVFYSGHGFLDKHTNKYFLVPHFNTNLLSAETFNQKLQEIQVQKLLVIIDTCHRKWQISNDNDNSQEKLRSELLIELNAHENEISTLALTKEKEQESYYIATGGEDKKLHIWKYLPQQHMLLKQPEDMGALEKIDVGLSEQQLRIVTLGKNGKPLIWNLNSQIYNPNNTNFNNLEDVEKVALSNDKKLLAVIRKNGEGEFYDLSGKLQNDFKTDLETITSLSFRPDGKVIAIVVKEDNQYRVYSWKKSKGKSPENYFDVGTNEINYLKYSPDGNYLAMITTNYKLKIFSSIGDEIYTSPINEKVTTFSFISNKNKIYIIMGQTNGKISLWKLNKEQLEAIPINEWKNNIHNGPINTVISSDDGDYIASLDDERNPKAKLWRLKDSNSKNSQVTVEEIKLDWRNQTPSNIISLTFSPSYEFGELIAGGDKNGKIHIWDMKGRQIAEFKPEGEADKITEVTDIIFTPKRNYPENFIVVAYKNGIVRRWQVGELNYLINKGCDWLDNYFSNHPNEQNQLGCP